jgi:hypothetical protein
MLDIISDIVYIFGILSPLVQVVTMFKDDNYNKRQKTKDKRQKYCNSFG